MKLIRLTVMF